LDNEGTIDSEGMLDKDGTLDKDGIFEKDGMLDKEGIFEKDGILDNDGLLDIEGVVDKEGILDREGMMDIDGILDEEGIWDEDGMLEGVAWYLVFVISDPIIVTAVCASAFPIKLLLSWKAISVLHRITPFMLDPGSRTVFPATTQKMFCGKAPPVRVTIPPELIVRTPAVCMNQVSVAIP